ncbi:MAG: sulfurtransferase TusA family protein [Candidatus Obscuribacterales bacterium]
MTEHELNLEGVACPMNFVKTRLYLDKMAQGERLSVTLDAGEPVESVARSVTAEGHVVEEQLELSDTLWRLVIRKA